MNHSLGHAMGQTLWLRERNKPRAMKRKETEQLRVSGLEEDVRETK